MNRCSALALLSVFCLSSASAGSRPETHSEKLAEVPKRMNEFVKEGVIAGAVTLVGVRGEIARLDAVGLADIENRKPMRADSLFWVASMTKPITATAVMLLQDEGKLSMDDPVEKHLPEFRNQWLVASRGSDSLTLTRPNRPITLRDLLTHTSGLSDLAPPRPNCSLAELVMAYAQLPLQFEPGSRWQYCNSGINTLGRVVEVVSGQPFEDFLEQRFFKPLGMKDTTFWPSGAKAKRVVKAYKPGAGGKKLEETDISLIKGHWSQRQRPPIPAGGLFSTASDIFRFYQMVLDGGTWRGKRLVSRTAVDLMTSTQTANLKTGFTDGMSFGLGWAVVKEPKGITELLSAGTFGHGGAYGTQGWVDPKKEVVLVLMIQRANLPNADGSEMRRVFQETVLRSLPD